MVVVRAPMSPVRRVPEKSMQPYLWRPLMYRTNLPNASVGFLLAGKKHFPYQLFRDSRKFRGHFQRLPHRSLCRQWFRFANHLRDAQGAHFGLQTQPQNRNPQRSRWQCTSGQCDVGVCFGYRCGGRKTCHTLQAALECWRSTFRIDRTARYPSACPCRWLKQAVGWLPAPAFLNLPIAALTNYT